MGLGGRVQTCGRGCAVTQLEAFIKARAQGAATTYRVARLLSLPPHRATWIAAGYLFTGRTKTYKIENSQWRVTP